METETASVKQSIRTAFIAVIVMFTCGVGLPCVG